MTTESSHPITELSALLGEDCEYEGSLAFRGRVRIDGTFKGNVSSEGILVLGQNAIVDANIKIGILIVLGGTVRGNVLATKLVELHAPAIIHADIESPELFVDKGVALHGKCITSTTTTDEQTNDS